MPQLRCLPCSSLAVPVGSNPLLGVSLCYSVVSHQPFSFVHVGVRGWAPETLDETMLSSLDARYDLV